MAMYGSKVRQMVRKWQKFTRPSRAYTTLNSDIISTYHTFTWDSPCLQKDSEISFASPPDDAPEGFLTVYVGRDKRRYVVSSQYLSYPLFRSLIERSEKVGDQREGLSVPCEVVLFEHLLWMLRNDDSGARQMESMDELVDFYACL